MQWLWACFDDSSAAAAPPPIRAAPLRTANMLAMAIAWRLRLGWAGPVGDVIRAGRRRLSRGGSSPNNYRRKKAARAKTSPAGRSADVRARGRQKHADPSESVRASATPSTANSRRKKSRRRLSCLRVYNLLSRDTDRTSGGRQPQSHRYTTAPKIKPIGTTFLGQSLLPCAPDAATARPVGARSLRATPRRAADDSHRDRGVAAIRLGPTSSGALLVDASRNAPRRPPLRGHRSDPAPRRRAARSDR